MSLSPRQLDLPGGQFSVQILEAGTGPELLYLHGIWDAGEHAFLERLAEGFHVVAPRFPGFGKSTGEQHLQDIHDAIYYHLDLLDCLGFDGGILIGHCLGGMMAAELAAVQPRRFSRLGLIAPFGLWNAQHQALDFFAAGRQELHAALYGASASQGSQGPAEATPSSPAEETDEQREARIQAQVEGAKAMMAAARFLWPLPNRGLAKRLHRVSLATALVWGSEDGILPPAYGSDFQALIRGSKLQVIPGAGHLPHIQKPAETHSALSL